MPKEPRPPVPSPFLSVFHESEAAHGAPWINGLTVRSYNLEIRDGSGFVGDKASGRAFRSFLQDWRLTLQEMGKDPFEEPLDQPVSKKTLGKLLAAGDPDAAAVVHGAIEDYAHNLAGVIASYLKQESWQDITHIVVGGGLSQSRVGKLAVARANALLQSEGTTVKLRTIRHDADEAGVLGALQIAPESCILNYDGIIGVDIGGSNIRCGIVLSRRAKNAQLKRAKVRELMVWRHDNCHDLHRDDAVKKLGRMIVRLLARAKKTGILLAPFIGIACPGLIDSDGRIIRGAQNLPGDWAAPEFHLVELLFQAMPEVAGRPMILAIHNDAVVQGLSEYPWMKGIRDWGVLTIGTGLGNASFRNTHL